VLILSDFDKFIELLNAWGVDYSIEKEDVVLSADTKKVEGYTCFETVVYFTNGKFIKFGLWE
jgi:hypothetical protein